VDYEKETVADLLAWITGRREVLKARKDHLVSTAQIDEAELLKWDAAEKLIIETAQCSAYEMNPADSIEARILSDDPVLMAKELKVATERAATV
jgi:hypothetical protein